MVAAGFEAEDRGAAMAVSLGVEKAGATVGVGLEAEAVEDGSKTRM